MLRNQAHPPFLSYGQVRGAIVVRHSLDRKTPFVELQGSSEIPNPLPRIFSWFSSCNCLQR